MNEIGNLTPYQLRNIFFLPEKDDSDVNWYAKQKDACYKLWMDHKGKTKEEADVLWFDYSQKLLANSNTPPDTKPTMG